MSKLKNELQKQIAKYIFENTDIDTEIDNLITDGIDDSIDYSSEDADHKKPKNIPSDSIILMKQPEFPVIDSFTKLRRRVYRKLGKSAQETRDKMKAKTLASTKLSMTLDDTTIKIKIENRSPLLVYLRSGKLGETARKSVGAIRKEAGFIMMLAVEQGIADDSDIKQYMKELTDLADGKGTIGKIPIRDVLRASSELIGKDFIRKNIL